MYILKTFHHDNSHKIYNENVNDESAEIMNMDKSETKEPRNEESEIQQQEIMTVEDTKMVIRIMRLFMITFSVLSSNSHKITSQINREEM